MSTSPPAALLSRRSLLRGAASAGLLALLAGACAASDPAPNDAESGNDGSDLLALGQALAAGPDGAALAASPPAGLGTVTSDDEAMRSVRGYQAMIEADFGAARTSLGDGWLLADTEAAVLVAYAGACPAAAC